MIKYDSQGREIPDPIPMEVPLNFQRPETLREQIQRLIRSELSNVAGSQGLETFEEADDFDIEEDEPRSQWELDDDQFAADVRDNQDAGSAESGGSERGRSILHESGAGGPASGGGKDVAPSGEGRNAALSVAEGARKAAAA